MRKGQFQAKKAKLVNLLFLKVNGKLRLNSKNPKLQKIQDHEGRPLHCESLWWNIFNIFNIECFFSPWATNRTSTQTTQTPRPTSQLGRAFSRACSTCQMKCGNLARIENVSCSRHTLQYMILAPLLDPLFVVLAQSSLSWNLALSLDIQGKGCSQGRCLGTAKWELRVLWRDGCPHQG